MVYAGETPQAVVNYTPHGCRHVSVTAATQLAFQGVISDSSIEYLGHWKKGSKMTRHYDSAACVTELSTRKTISDALRSGWRPATDGNLPTPATPAGSNSACPGTPALPFNALPVPTDVEPKVESAKKDKDSDYDDIAAE